MRKNKAIFLVLLIFIFALTGCQNKITNEDTKSKVIQEIDFLDTKVVSILNKLNNISLQDYTITSEEISLGEESSSGESSSSGENGQNSNQSSSSQGGQSDNQKSGSQSQSSGETNIKTTEMESENILESNENNIDWKTIKSEIETINEAWAVVILDLSSLNVDNNDVLNFSSTLDDSILSVKDEDKASSLTNLAKLYSIIPNLESGIAAPNSTQNIKQVKSNIINAYSFVEQDDWGSVENSMIDAEKNFKNLTNDMEYVRDKEYKVNRTYVLLKELQNSLSYRDKKLFHVKYKNLMESINVL